MVLSPSFCLVIIKIVIFIQRGAEVAELRQEMYSEERRETMQQQVTSLHHSSSHHQEQQANTTTSQEAQEWQQLARKEKHHVEYAESSHFSMVRNSLFRLLFDVTAA